MVIFRCISWLVLALVLQGIAFGQLSSGGLQGGEGLGGSKLQSSKLERSKLQTSRLQGGKAQGSGKLEGEGVQGSELETSKTQSSKLDSAPKKALEPAALKKAASGLARASLSSAGLHGSVSSVPESQLGTLFYDVGQVLEQMEEGVTETSVGYYMASLTDPEGERFKAAKKRLEEIILDDDLTYEQAVSLYDGGLATFTRLYQMKLGMTSESVQVGMLEMRKIKVAYHRKREAAGLHKEER